MHPKFYNTAGAGDFMHMNQYMSLSHHVQNLRFESGYNGHQVVLPNGIKAIVDRNLVRQLIKRESLDQMFQYSRTQASEDIRRLSEGDMECPPYQLFRNFNFASPFAAKDVPTARFHERLVLRSPEEMREIRKDLFENGKFIDDPYMEEAAYPPLPSLQPNKQWAAVARNTEEPVVWPQINPNRIPQSECQTQRKLACKDCGSGHSPARCPHDGLNKQIGLFSKSPRRTRRRRSGHVHYGKNRK